MDATRFSAVARSVESGQHVKITFKADGNGITTLSRLSRAYCGQDGFDVVPKDKIIVSSVVSSQNWGGDKNRTIGFVGVEKLDEDTLCMISRDADSIVVA